MNFIILSCFFVLTISPSPKFNNPAIFEAVHAPLLYDASCFAVILTFNILFYGLSIAIVFLVVSLLFF